MDENAILDILDWLELTTIGTVIRESMWLFPVIESVHLLALALLGGAIIIGDLRLAGLGLNKQPIAYVIKQTQPWLITALVAIFATGIPLFLSEAVKCYYSDAFWVKIIALITGLFFVFVIRNPLAKKPELKPWLGLSIGILSFSIWTVVAAAGRWVGFS